jgi:hypothetical protein
VIQTGGQAFVLVPVLDISTHNRVFERCCGSQSRAPTITQIACESGAEAHALQALARILDGLKLRGASGVRALQRRFRRPETIPLSVDRSSDGIEHIR